MGEGGGGYPRLFLPSRPRRSPLRCAVGTPLEKNIFGAFSKANARQRKVCWSRRIQEEQACES
jgi:hypothetical protein